MGEAHDYSAHCPVCGGFVYLMTRLDLNEEMQMEYVCHSCKKVFENM